MRLRTKLLLTFVPTMVVGLMIVTELVEQRGERHIYSLYQAKALSIAATAAAMLDGDVHQTLTTRSHQYSEEYSEISHLLRQVRDANRRRDSWVTFVYTVMPSPTSSGVLVFAVDPEEDESKRSQLLEVVHANELKGADLTRPRVFDDFISDQFGTWLKAFYPVRNSKGEVVAALGIDIDRQRIREHSDDLFHESLVIASAAIAFGLVLVLWLNHKVSRPMEQFAVAIQKVEAGDYEFEMSVNGNDEIAQASVALKSLAVSLKERERVKTAFARYVSHQVADAVLHSDVDQSSMCKGERRRITVLFCDIRGFTTMSEKLPPEEVVAVLNEFFERMVEVIFKHGGTLDKFLGDGLMAIFGAPTEDPHQEEHAVRAALEMRQAVHVLSERLKREQGVVLDVGLGINSGSAIVGTIGSSQRMEYTAIGDTVNLASRLESHTKELGVEILVSDYTRVEIRGELAKLLVQVGALKIRGRSGEVTAWTVPVTEGCNEYLDKNKAPASVAGTPDQA